MSIGTLVAGLIAIYWGAFVFSSACLFLAFFLSLTLPHVGEVKLKPPFFPKALLKKNWNVYVPFFLRHLGANCIWVIFSLYIASLGGNNFWVGAIWAVNWATQFIVMQFLDSFKEKTLLNVGLALSFITFLTFSFAQNFLHLIPVQVISAISWACLYVGSLVYLMKHNVERSTSSGILGSLTNLGVVFGSLIGGTLSELFDFRATMYAAAGLTLIGFFLFKFSNRGSIVAKRVSEQ